jgi:membrane-anchored protein YejM (alkaline phosphatase superfamily)
MPQLDRWARNGLRCLNHFAGTNVSHFGMFSILYGRSPMVYDLTLDAGLPPQLTTTFRNCGYRCAYLSGGTLPWARMEEFINESTFDSVQLTYERDWADRDRCVLRRLQATTRDRPDRPQLNVVFLISSHYDYDYPLEYERCLPVVSRNSGEGADGRLYRQKLLNRYRNSLAFLDDEIGNLIDRLDPSKNIIAVTGDHGESFLDDGVYTHNSKGSDAQTHVPLAIVGPGVPQTTITGYTRHADIVPTLLNLAAGQHVPLRHSHGKDILVTRNRDHTVQFTTPRAPEGHRLLLMRGDERFRVRVMLGRHPFVEAEGYFDHSDKLRVNRIPGQQDIAKWRDVVLEELLLMAD